MAMWTFTLRVSTEKGRAGVRRKDKAGMLAAFSCFGFFVVCLPHLLHADAIIKMDLSAGRRQHTF
jgi:hypothetical protein